MVQSLLFDTHAHLTDPAFDGDRDALIASLSDVGIGTVLVPGTSVESSLAARDLARKYENVYFAAGIHPSDVEGMGFSDLDRIAEIAADPKCVAIGEIGLDFHYGAPEMRDTQRYWFLQQLHLAYECNLPVIVHDREAHRECFDAVAKTGVRGVFHCYSSSAEMAEELVRIGFYCSFTGVITYPGAKKASRAIESLPSDRILIETDSPYLSPEPLRGTRNDPRNVIRVAEMIAKIRSVSVEEVIALTNANARRLFRI